jgi:DNA-binding XRE family transcriptional regulator/mannose-6-phosphate isomerase-like protein (cupin superfamily)
MTDLLRDVSTNLREARQAAGLSQAALAARADVSRRMITMIEAAEGNVSLGTLDRLATALGLAFAELVRPAGTAWRGQAPGSQARLVAASPATGMVELWDWTLAPGERYVAEPDRPGMREMILVVDGSLILDRAGTREILAAGQSTVFASDQPYAYENPGPGIVRFVKNVLA